MSSTGEVVVITGASGGVGRAAARRFGAEGARVNIIGERVAPWLLDRYLAKTGFGSQMTQYDLDPHRHDNLFKPVDEDRGAHGPFDDKAHSVSPRYELAKRRGLVLAGLGAAAGGAAAAALRNGN